MTKYFEPKILHQGIDFLTIDYFAKDYGVYLAKFIPILDKLQILKEKAQAQDEFGHKFIKDDLGLNLGNFFISSRGLHRFRYYLENDDFRIFISTAKLNGDLPQIRVEIPAKTLLKVDVNIAINTFEVFVEKLIGSSYERKINRIDLATDVWGIQYTPLDLYRFQTRMGQSGYISEYDIASYMRFQRMQGFQFGKGAKLFRIYDKTHKINLSPNEKYIIEKWKFNGYDEEKGYPVFRHEIQYRRDEIKLFIPKYIDDEVNFILKNIPNLWAKALTYVEFVNLTEDEISRIYNNPVIKSDTKRKIFYRAKKDIKRFNLWQCIRAWENKYSNPIEKLRFVKDYAVDIVKKQFKGFISTYYKYFGNNIDKLKDFVVEVEEDLYKKENITLHQYGLIKLADSFVKDYESVLISGEVLSPKIYHSIVSAYEDFIETLKSINNPKYKNTLKKAVNYV